jgi:putative ABC transport system permease protein
MPKVSRTLGGRLGVMDLPAAERAFTADGFVNQIDLLLTDDADVDRTRAAVAARLPPGVEVVEPAARRDVIRRTVAGFQAMLAVFGYLAVAAGFLVCYGRLGAIFEARAWEVGLLRAVGLRRSTVFRELLKESLLLGASGTAVGLGAGIVIARLGLPLIATATALNFRFPPIAATAQVRVGALVLGTAVGLVAAVAAAVVPALRVAWRQPIAALTLRGRESIGGAPGRPGWLALLFLAIGIGAAAWQRHDGGSGAGLLASGAFVLAGCALAGPLVRRAAPPLKVVWRSMFGPLGELACERLCEQPRRSALTVATLGVGLGVILLFGILGWSFERTLVSLMSAHLQADLVVHSAQVSGGWQTAEIADDIVAEVARIPGVALAAGEHVREIANGADGTILNGYDAVSFFDASFLNFPLEPGARTGALETVARGAGVLVTDSFARKLNVEPGAIVTVPSPHGPQHLTVVGIAPTEPMNAILLAREHYRDTWNDHRVTWVHVKLAPGAERAVVAATIAREVGAKYRVQVRTPKDLVEYFAGQARQAFSALYVVEVVTLLLVLVGIGDTLATAVLERTREIGMTRAVGLRRSHVFAAVVLEGLAIGVIGLVLAGVIGLTLGAYWVEFQFPAMLGWALELHLPLRFAIGAILLTLALCVLGACLPAVGAARLSPVAALRAE